MADTGLDDGGRGYFECPKCGKKEGDFDEESHAKLALRLHLIGCPKNK